MYYISCNYNIISYLKFLPKSFNFWRKNQKKSVKFWKIYHKCRMFLRYSVELALKKIYIFTEILQIIWAFLTQFFSIQIVSFCFYFFSSHLNTKNYGNLEIMTNYVIPFAITFRTRSTKTMRSTKLWVRLNPLLQKRQRVLINGAFFVKFS